ncbi:diguanylate cyclase [Zobellella sp. DQSA1]|uniref:diguanylate cyclase n=1 Tax=Zobellella sp. DQSA1 TaxID=3342386 RepID=UPI0035C0BA2B
MPVLANAPPAALSASERAYINAHPSISLCVDPDWWPFEAIDKHGQHVGIAADLIAIAAANTGLQVQLHPTATWEESLIASRAGDCMALSFLNQTPEREQWLIFTAPLLEDPNVLITREEHPFISDVSALTGKTIALPYGTAMAEFFARDFPHIEIVYTDSESEALRLVSERKVDMTLRSLIMAAHTIKNEGWFNLKVSGQIPGYDNRLRMGVLKSEQTLRDILDKGIATLTPEQRQQIMGRHTAMNMVSQVVTDYTLVYALGATLTAVLATSLFWMRRLNGLNRRLKILAQTDQLTGLPNRHALNGIFHKELNLAQRYQRPLAVIMLDLDHFKHINDEQGHLTGDKVLVDFSLLLQHNLREADSLCRWGGEEFMLLCPETDADQALELTGRLLTAARGHAFPGSSRVTVSAGVSTATPTDSVETLVQRADAALYQAKAEGRDRACLAVHDTAA